MRILFIRVAAVLFLTLLAGIGLIIYVAIASYLQQLVDQHIEATERVHKVLVAELDSQPQQEWLRVIQRIETLLDYQIDVLEPPQGSESAAAMPIIERAVPSLSRDKISAQWPWPGGSGRSVRYTHTYIVDWKWEDILLFALLFIALPVVLYLTLRPIARKITDLSHVARAYAEGNLDAQSSVAAPKPLEQLAGDMQQMASALQRKIQEQRVMTHAISHELKTPLTRMRMANDVALLELDPDAWEQHLFELNDDLTALEKIMAETLTLTRLTFQDKPLTSEPLALHEVVVESLQECVPGAVDVQINIPLDVFVVTNSNAIKRVFVNVLNNALRFARHRVCVSVTAQADQWVTTIEDDGPGIPLEDREKIFMPFGRVESSRSRASGGTGMGLAIVALLIEKCGGSIWLDGSPQRRHPAPLSHERKSRTTQFGGDAEFMCQESSMGGARFYIALPAEHSVCHAD